MDQRADVDIFESIGTRIDASYRPLDVLLGVPPALELSKVNAF